MPFNSLTDGPICLESCSYVLLKLLLPVSFTINCRSRQDLNLIFKSLHDKNAMLKTVVDKVELLVFTSKGLDEDSQGMVLYYRFSHISCFYNCIKVAWFLR